MKFIHLSDLHLGKRVNEFSMIEDQKFILSDIINVIENEKPDCVIIAGDIYDKSVPSAEAVELFDEFLVELLKKNVEVFAISGNHDSPERIAFGGRIMDNSGIHMSPVYNGEVCPVTIEDSYGKVNIYMLPFIKPSNVRRFYPDEEIESYTDAVRVAVSHMNVDKNERNIIVTHQFVTGATRSDSEDISVGGTDNVDVRVFDDFDYVALGHIHSPQKCTKDTVRYCGTPLKYSFSEANDKKSLPVVEIKEKGNVIIQFKSPKPLRDMKEIKGKYADIIEKSYYEDTTYQNDYMHITLTDENDIPDVIGKLRTVYKNLMKLDYDNARTASSSEINGVENIEKMSPDDLFSDFYKLQNNTELSGEQKEFMQKLIENVWEDKE